MTASEPRSAVCERRTRDRVSRACHSRDRVTLQTPRRRVEHGARVFAHEVHARYINDCRDKRVHNVSFDKRPSEQRALVVALRPIAAGDELYASYGPLYWLGADMRGEPSARLPESAVEALMAREREYWDGRAA